MNPPATGGDAVMRAINTCDPFYMVVSDEYKGPVVPFWSPNAAEQIEAALAESGWEVTRIEPTSV